MARRGPADAATAVAAELCALPLARFTPERNARARTARSAGDRELAARIAALPKPSVAAWVVDAIGRDAPKDLERVLALGPALRSAQEDGDRDRLRALAGERRTLLSDVVTAAAERAEACGQRVSGGVREEVEQTLLAAIGSEAAAAAVRSGRLVRALAADGLEEADLADLVAGEPPVVPEEPGSRAEEDHDRAADRRAEQRADALRHAREQADQAVRDARDAAETEQEAADAVERLRSRLRTAETALDEARGAAETAQRTAEAAEAAVAALAED